MGRVTGKFQTGTKITYSAPGVYPRNARYLLRCRGSSSGAADRAPVPRVKRTETRRHRL